MLIDNKTVLLNDIVSLLKQQAVEITKLFEGMSIENLSFVNPIRNMKSYSGKYYLGLSDKNGKKVTVICSSAMFDKQSELFGLGDKSNIDIKISKIDLDKNAKLIITASSIVANGVSQRELEKRRIINYANKKGYFDRGRKIIPSFVQNIALITTNTGNTRDDIFNQIGLSSKYVKLFTPPSNEKDIAQTLNYASNCGDFQVVVLFRGGNEDEHMLKFSQECVLDAVASSPIPVCSAIGHDADQPIVQDIVDCKFSTPSSFANYINKNNSIFFDGVLNMENKINETYISLLRNVYKTILNTQKNINNHEQKIIKTLLPVHTESIYETIRNNTTKILLNGIYNDVIVLGGEISHTADELVMQNKIHKQKKVIAITVITLIIVVTSAFLWFFIE